MTKEVTAAKVPLVYVNRKPDNLPKGVLYVGSDSIDAGQFVGEEVSKAIGGKGNVVILLGELQNEAALKRTGGTKKGPAKPPGLKIIPAETRNWPRTESPTLTENCVPPRDKN